MGCSLVSGFLGSTFDSVGILVRLVTVTAVSVDLASFFLSLVITLAVDVDVAVDATVVSNWTAQATCCVIEMCAETIRRGNEDKRTRQARGQEDGGGKGIMRRRTAYL